MAQNTETMARFEQDAHSFVVRLWYEHTTTDAQWRGWVQHVQTGAKHYFESETAFNQIMSNYLSHTPKLKDVLTKVE